jgi:anthranilate synthase component II
MVKILVLDNYDSFTYNLVHAIEKITQIRPDVFRNDQIDPSTIEKYDKIVLSPGPGIPEEAGILKSVIDHYAPRKAILGVCLGHQAIGEVFGAKLLNLRQVFHGIATDIKIEDLGEPLFHGLPEIIKAGRYHSWIVSRENLPDCFEVIATDSEGEIMAMKHKQYNVRGIQFHPESVLTDYGEKIIENWLNL